MKKEKSVFAHTPLILHPQSPHLGPLPLFLRYCATKRPPGVLTLRRDRVSERRKKKKSKKKKDFFFSFGVSTSHADLFRLGAVRRTLAQSHADVLDHCATT
jgi:hypothetical protein